MRPPGIPRSYTSTPFTQGLPGKDSHTSVDVKASGEEAWTAEPGHICAAETYPRFGITVVSHPSCTCSDGLRDRTDKGGCPDPPHRSYTSHSPTRQPGLWCPQCPLKAVWAVLWPADQLPAWYPRHPPPTSRSSQLSSLKEADRIFERSGSGALQ